MVRKSAAPISFSKRADSVRMQLDNLKRDDRLLVAGVIAAAIIACLWAMAMAG